ncbi:MAG: hypothetical protein M0P57_07310 [Syntrophales bacterium]|jgi:hypothetical protein|nr:hypothetical protein [Syntrophales bacterium]MDY0043027.1 hypothetical protein [Syntrophales bacterium]
MKKFQVSESTLRKALQAAYRERAAGPFEAEGFWRMEVMSHVRRLELPAQKNAVSFFNERLWRLTPALCLLIVMLTAAVAAVDMSMEREVMQFFAADPVEFTVAQLME